MDIKITGVTFEIMRDALEQAQARAATFILGKMAEAIGAPREQLSEFAPRISSIQIDPEKIGLLIGKGGETIRSLQEEYESQIDVNDEGQVLVYAVTGAKGDALVDRIRSMTKEVEVGDELPGQGRQDHDLRRLRRARQGHRRPAAHLQRLAGQPRRRRSRRCSTRATRSPSASSRSTRSAAASACASPRTPRSPARPRRSWPPSAPATRRWAAAAATVRARRRGGDRNGRGGRGGGRGGGRDRGRDRDRAPRAATAIPTAGNGHTPSHRITELDSGLRIVTEAMPSVRSAALGFFVATGSRGESVAEAGLSHFLEHLLFRGTDRYASAEIDQLFDGMGAELNAGTDKESTAVYARMLDQHLPAAFDVMADMVWRPAFNDVDPEREVVLEEIAMYEDDPQDTVFDVLGEAVFGGHPLGRPIIGRAPVIRDTPVDVIADFHARRYVPGAVVIAAAGSVDHDAIVELARKTRARARPTASPAPAPEPAPASPSANVRFVRKDTEQVPRHARRPRPASAATTAASPPACWTRSSAGCRRSRLFQAVREERGLAYSVYSFAGQYADTGQVGLYVGTRPDNLRRGDEGRRRRARPPARGARPPRRSSCARARTSRRGSCSAWSPPARGCTGSAARCCSICRCWRPTR